MSPCVFHNTLAASTPRLQHNLEDAPFPSLNQLRQEEGRRVTSTSLRLLSSRYHFLWFPSVTQLRVWFLRVLQRATSPFPARPHQPPSTFNAACRHIHVAKCSQLPIGHSHFLAPPTHLPIVVVCVRPPTIQCSTVPSGNILFWTPTTVITQSSEQQARLAPLSTVTLSVSVHSFCDLQFRGCPYSSTVYFEPRVMGPLFWSLPWQRRCQVFDVRMADVRMTATEAAAAFQHMSALFTKHGLLASPHTPRTRCSVLGSKSTPRTWLRQLWARPLNWHWQILPTWEQSNANCVVV